MTKKIYKLPPCPTYHIREIEIWLEKMAQEGKIFKNTKWFFVFTIEKPRRIRYRFQPLPKEKSWLNRSDNVKEAEVLQEICESMGWHYLYQIDSFCLFATEDSQAPELNTDNDLLAHNIHRLKKNSWWQLLSELFFLLSVVYSYCRIGFLTGTIVLGTFTTLCLFAFLVSFPLQTLFKIHYLKKLYQHLLDSQEQNPKPFSHQRLYKIGRITKMAFACILLWQMTLLFFHDQTVNQRLDTYQKELPFATLQDFNPDGAYTLSKYAVKNNNEIGQGSDFLAPAYFHVYETAAVKLDNGSTLEAILSIDYFETRSSWIANQLAKECRRYDIKQEGPAEDLNMDLSQYPIDKSIAYQTPLYTHLILVSDGYMIHISFTELSPSPSVSFLEWTNLMTEIFVQKNCSD